MALWLKGIFSCISMLLRHPLNIIILSYLYVREQWKEPGARLRLQHSGCVSKDGPGVFKWPVISRYAHKDGFQMGETDLSLLFLALIIHLSASATCLHRDKMGKKTNTEPKKTKNTHTAILQINNQLTKAVKLFIINNRRVC